MSGQSGCRGWLHCRIGDFELQLDWDLDPGNTLVLFGQSGSGKTTALRALAGLIRPVAGRVEIGGRTVFDSAEGVWTPAHRRQIGYLTQQYHLFPASQPGTESLLRACRQPEREGGHAC